MKDLRIVLIGLAVIGLGLFAQQANDAHAAFHFMRIYAVMGGLNGDANVQYVELRMCSAGQPFVAGHTLKFYDGSNTLKATFTFPANVTMSSTAESILIATSEYNTASTGPGGGGSGGDADFVFSMANTVGANGGDPLHPVQAPNGRVTFAEGAGTGCQPSVPVDSVAYGTGVPDYAPPESNCNDAVDNDNDGFINDACGASPPAETACADALDNDGDTLVNDGCPAIGARPLPSPSNVCVLRLAGTLLSGPTNNSTQYSIQSTSATAKTVASGSLSTDLDTPRNNARQVATLGTADADCDGVGNPTDNCPNAPNPGQQNVVHPGTTAGDHCEDPEPDGVVDANDNCPDDVNPGQGNFDLDTPGDACDPDDDNDTIPDTSDTDDDNDKVFDVAEANCGGTTPSNLRPERVDGIFDNVDDDGDTLMDEALPGGSGGFDCDGDGYTGSAENVVYSYLAGPPTDGDQKTCQEPDLTFPNSAMHIKPSMRWPSDIAGAGVFSANKINVQDLSSFTAPIRYLGQNVGTDPGDVRFDLAPSTPPAPDISISDLARVTSGITGTPPMLGGLRAFNGPVCPYAP